MDKVSRDSRKHKRNFDIPRLNGIIASAQGGTELQPKSQLETILYRIASGRGKPVPLPEIQQGSKGSFVSDPQARISDLRDAGYDIKTDSTRVKGRTHTTYQLIGTCPKNETFLERYKREHPKPQGWKSQPFSYGNKPAQPASISTFLDFETGGRR